MDELEIEEPIPLPVIEDHVQWLRKPYNFDT